MPHVDESLLHTWLDDEVSAAEAQTLEEHLETCLSCQRMLDEAARTRALAGELIADLTADSVPDWEDLVARTTEPGKRSPAVTPAPPRRLLMPALAWAATLVFAFLLGRQVRLAAGPSPEQRQLVAALEPGADEGESELEVSVEGELLQQELRAESQAATPQPRATEREQRVAMAEKSAAGEVLPQVASPEIGRASVRRRERAAVVANVAEPEEEQLEAVPAAAAPLGRMAAGQLLSADTIERAQAPSAEQAEFTAGEERPQMQLTGAVLESAETVDSGMRPAAEGAREVLRAVYQDPQTGVRVTLLQWLVAPADRARIGADLGSGPATATLTVPADGTPSLRWLTPAGVLLTLEADLDEAGLRQLALRVR